MKKEVKFYIFKEGVTTKGPVPIVSSDQDYPTNDRIKFYQSLGYSVKESEECPTNEFESGNPKGKCWGDGHYRCKECKHYREDFKRNGQDYIDFAHMIQSYPRIHNLSTNESNSRKNKHND